MEVLAKGVDLLAHLFEYLLTEVVAHEHVDVIAALLDVEVVQVP